MVTRPARNRQVRRATTPCSPRPRRCPASGRGWASSWRNLQAHWSSTSCGTCPSPWSTRRNAPEIVRAKAGEIATLTVTVDEHLVPRNPRQPYRVWCSDETGRLCLTYFNGREDYLKKLLPPGEVRVVSGKVEIYQGEVQMTHPDHVIVIDQQREQILRVEPVYGLTAGLTQRPVRSHRQRRRALARAARVAGRGLPQAQQVGELACRAGALTPTPDEETDLSPTHPARARLAFDELLASQLAIALVRHHNRTVAGHVTKGDGKLRAKVLKSLPFEPSQKTAVGEIAADMAKAERMIRLLQKGDVGSGKTLVALLAMLICVEAGAQAALMAPTEILARQRHATIAPLAEAAGVRLALLTGRDGQKQKRRPCRGSPTARSISSSARTRWCRRTSSSPTSRSPWSTSSTASACTSAWRCRPRAMPSTCW